MNISICSYVLLNYILLSKPNVSASKSSTFSLTVGWGCGNLSVHWTPIERLTEYRMKCTGWFWRCSNQTEDRETAESETMNTGKVDTGDQEQDWCWGCGSNVRQSGRPQNRPLPNETWQCTRKARILDSSVYKHLHAPRQRIDISHSFAVIFPSNWSVQLALCEGDCHSAPQTSIVCLENNCLWT